MNNDDDEQNRDVGYVLYAIIVCRAQLCYRARLSSRRRLSVRLSVTRWYSASELVTVGSQWVDQGLYQLFMNPPASASNDTGVAKKGKEKVEFSANKSLYLEKDRR